MMKWVWMVLMILGMVQPAFAQPPLSKRLQKEKAEFEALIAREAKYDSLVAAADRAFKAKDYILARMTYEDAIPYNDEKAQWLQSKVNDLDILMAKNAARSVDSIVVSLTPKEIQQLKSEDRAVTLEDRTIGAPLPLPAIEAGVDTVEKAIEMEEVQQLEKTVAETPAVEPPAPKPVPRPEPSIKKEQVKVKEDFSSYDDGITEETFDLQNHSVLRIVVKEGIDVMVFKRVKHNWGGEFYFLDDVATTKRYWSDQVATYREKYGSTGN